MRRCIDDCAFSEWRLVCSPEMMRHVERRQKTGESKRGMHGYQGSTQVSEYQMVIMSAP